MYLIYLEEVHLYLEPDFGAGHKSGQVARLGRKIFEKSYSPKALSKTFFKQRSACWTTSFLQKESFPDLSRKGFSDFIVSHYFPRGQEF